MQQIVGYKPELHLIIIYIKYQSTVNSLKWDIESILEFDYEGASTPMGPSDPCFELIILDDTVYKDLMSFQFTFVHKWRFGYYASLHMDK